MGKSFIGGMALGFAQSLQKAQEQAMMEEYKNAQIQTIKAEQKLKEAKLNQELQEWSYVKEAFDKVRAQEAAMGGQGAMMPGMQGGPPADVPPPTPMPPGSPVPQMPNYQGPPIQPQISGGNQFEPIIRQAAQKYGVDENLAVAIAKHESNFNPQARSPKGAMGIMQLMPKTAAGLGVQNPWDPIQNIEGGVKYIRAVQDELKTTDPVLTAAGYNAGPGAVQKHGGVPPYEETQAFSRRVAGSLPMQMAQATAPQFQTQPQAQATPPNAYVGSVPQAPLMSSRSIVEGYMKKKFGVEPNESLWKDMNGRQVLVDKKSGAPIVQMVTPGKQVMVAGTDDYGRPVQRWVQEPTLSPLPGVPILSQGPNGLQVGVSQGQGNRDVVTGPPKIGWEKKTLPDGSEYKVPYNEAVPGGPVSSAGGLGDVGTAMQTKPPTGAMSNKIPEDANKLMRKNEVIIGDIGYIESLFKPEYSGVGYFINNAAAKSSGFLDAIGIRIGDPQFKQFATAFQDLMRSNIVASAGAQMTKTELAMVMRTLPNVYERPELFKAALKGLKVLKALDNYITAQFETASDSDKLKGSAVNLAEFSKYVLANENRHPDAAKLLKEYEGIREKISANDPSAPKSKGKPALDSLPAESPQAAKPSLNGKQSGWTEKRGTDGRMYRVNPKTKEYILVE